MTYRQLIVFLNNKLGTCDAITPILYEVAERHPDTTVRFICFDHRTYDAIRKNIVLYDAICKIGGLQCLGTPERGLVAAIKARIALFRRLALWVLLAWSGRATFLHFRALHQWPLQTF